METKEQAATRRQDYNKKVYVPAERKVPKKPVQRLKELRTVLKGPGETPTQYQKRVNDALDRCIMNVAEWLGLEHGQAFVDTHTRVGTEHPFDSDYQDENKVSHVTAKRIDADTTELYWFRR